MIFTKVLLVISLLIQSRRLGELRKRPARINSKHILTNFLHYLHEKHMEQERRSCILIFGLKGYKMQLFGFKEKEKQSRQLEPTLAPVYELQIRKTHYLFVRNSEVSQHLSGLFKRQSSQISVGSCYCLLFLYLRRVRCWIILDKQNNNS